MPHSVHVAMPAEAPGDPRLSSLRVAAACGGCLLLGIGIGTFSQTVDTSFIVAPAMQRSTVGFVQPGLGAASSRYAVPGSTLNVVPHAEVSLQPSTATSSWPSSRWMAAGLFVPALVLLFAAFRHPGTSPQAMASLYGAADRQDTSLHAEADEDATIEDEAAFVGEAEAYVGPDLSAFVEDDGEGKGMRGKGRGKGKGKGRGKGKGKGKGDEMKEQVIQVRRVTKVVKGGKQLKFRVVVIVGDGKGRVGVGCASHKEVVGAVQKASQEARKEMITVPLNRSGTFPHPITVKIGAAQVWMKPAVDGTGVIAGGAVRAVMEAAGVQNCLAKQQGTGNPLSNARCAIQGLAQQRTLRQVAEDRGIELSSLLQ